MKRCSACILPENAPGIAFDSEGVCNYCRAYRRLQYQGEAEFAALLETHRKSNGRYDCVVTVSGGRDSTYTLLKVAKDHRMRVLAINYENPFTHPQARANVDHAVKALDVDLVRFQLPNRLHERTLCDNAMAWFRDPSPALVPMICIACKTIWWDILRITRQHDIQCIVSGGNRFEDVSFKKVLLGLSADEGAETTVTKAIVGLIRQNVEHSAFFKPRYIPTVVKGYLFADPYTPGSRLVGRNVHKIDLFFYVPWHEEEVLSRITDEVGWDYPHDLRSTWRFDCQVGHLKDLMYMASLGMTEREDFYAKMVREGQMSREHALDRLEQENTIHLDEAQDLLLAAGAEDASFLRDPKFWAQDCWLGSIL